MIIPIRCFTCNKVIAHLWDEYINRIQMAYLDDTIKKIDLLILKLLKKTIEGKIMDELKLKRYCCRRMMLSHVDLCEKI